MRDSLNQCKRTIGAGKINLEVGNIMKILPRIVASVVEFNLFMDEDPSAEWYRGEFIGIVEDETISDGDSEDFIMPYKAGRA